MIAVDPGTPRTEITVRNLQRNQAGISLNEIIIFKDAGGMTFVVGSMGTFTKVDPATASGSVILRPLPAGTKITFVTER
jgi:hypothetical protein